VIRFSKPLYQELKAIRSFLFTRMYRAPSVMVERARVTAVIDDLFPLFMAQPDLLPPNGRRMWRRRATMALARIVADYVAGMTDRFALQEHARLAFPTAPRRSARRGRP
jgi:dGTPase